MWMFFSRVFKGKRPSGYQLVSQRRPDNDQEGVRLGKKVGTFRAIYLTLLCCIGSFLFAYDTGIVGGILTLPSFQRDFGYTAQQKTQVNSNCVSVLQAGAFFGCFCTWPITARFGRRVGLMVSSSVFCIGAVLQVINSHEIRVFYVGRVIAGLGVGGATILVPMFCAEMAPKEIRGKLGSCFQLFFATGVAVSYWADYTCQVRISSASSSQWQVPIGLQLVPGALLGLGMLRLPESTRWLAKQGRIEEAYASLLWVRGSVETPEIRAEFEGIQAGVELEMAQSEGLTWKELWLPSNRYRIFIAITIQLCAQFTGNTSLAYYAPQILETINAGDRALFFTGFFGIAKIAGVLIFLVFFVEGFGRKKPFMFGALAMASAMFIIAFLAATNLPRKGTTSIGPASAASIATIYLEAIFFNMSWGPLPWLYISEIFPSRIREAGIASGAASQWFFNFVMSQITPYAIANIGWRTFVIFAMFNFAIVGYSWLFIKETSGKSLEEMEVVFGTVNKLPHEAGGYGGREAL